MTSQEALKEIFSLEKQLREFEEQHKLKIQAIRKQCQHDWHYEPDPSGNNDSGYTCLGCGKWTKRLPN